MSRLLTIEPDRKCVQVTKESADSHRKSSFEAEYELTDRRRYQWMIPFHLIHATKPLGYRNYITQILGTTKPI
jgi:hypothetical protein